jgi:hypothetical protein
MLADLPEIGSIRCFNNNELDSLYLWGAGSGVRGGAKSSKMSLRGKANTVSASVAGDFVAISKAKM